MCVFVWERKLLQALTKTPLERNTRSVGEAEVACGPGSGHRTGNVSLGEKISSKMSGGLGKAREGDFRLWGRGEGKSECNDKERRRRRGEEGEEM